MYDPDIHDRDYFDGSAQAAYEAEIEYRCKRFLEVFKDIKGRDLTSEEEAAFDKDPDSHVGMDSDIDFEDEVEQLVQVFLDEEEIA